jgi:hypothetical protein
MQEALELKLGPCGLNASLLAEVVGCCPHGSQPVGRKLINLNCN